MSGPKWAKAIVVLLAILAVLALANATLAQISRNFVLIDYVTWTEVNAPRPLTVDQLWKFWIMAVFFTTISAGALGLLYRNVPRKRSNPASEHPSPTN